MKTREVQIPVPGLGNWGSEKFYNLSNPRVQEAELACELWSASSFYDTNPTPIVKGVSCKPKDVWIEWILLFTETTALHKNGNYV